jgi:multisubunit Na+/H+ antiporter MnhG subunit
VSPHSIVAAVLVAAGVLVCVAASVGAVVAGDVLDRLHFVAPVTSAGTPLIGLGLAVDTGWHLATATIVVTVAVVAITGPVLAAATARTAAEERGIIAAESPE